MHDDSGSIEISGGHSQLQSNRLAAGHHRRLSRDIHGHDAGHSAIDKFNLLRAQRVFGQLDR